VCARVCALVALASLVILALGLTRLHWSLLVIIGAYPYIFMAAQVLPLGTPPIFLHSLLRPASVVKDAMSSLQFLSP